MLCFVLDSLLPWFIDLATLRFRSDRAKELEILRLRRQLACGVRKPQIRQRVHTDSGG